MLPTTTSVAPSAAPVNFPIRWSVLTRFVFGAFAVWVITISFILAYYPYLTAENSPDNLVFNQTHEQGSCQSIN
jgi:hypothetical protein